MKIRAVFIGCLSILLAMAGGLGLWLLADAAQRYNFASREKRAVDVSALLFDVADRLGALRPVVADLLVASPPADAAGLARVAAADQAFDQAIAAAQARIATTPGAQAARQIAILRKVRADRASWSARAAAEIARPRGERDPVFFGEFIDGFNPNFAVFDPVLDLGDVAAEQQDGLTMDLLTLARESWLVSEVISSRTGPVIASIYAGLPLQGPVLERAAQFDGRLAARWTMIDALGRRLSGNPALTATIAAGHAASAAFDVAYKNEVDAGRAGAAYPLGTAEFGDQSVGAGIVVLRIRDAALQLVRDRVVATRDAAGDLVVTVGAVLLLMAIGALAVLMLLARRFINPLIALTRAIRLLARGELGVTIPATARSDEIGAIASALEALRQSGIAAERAEARLSHMARHDALTGLPNRAELLERLEHAFQRGHAFALLCLGLDRFKAVNDTLGHVTGDRLLQAVADRLRGAVAESGIVARIGGDEFAVIFDDLDHSAAVGIVAQRIARALAEPFDMAGQSVSLGASIGVARAPRDAGLAMALLKCGDTALHRAKADGPGAVCYFEPNMDLQLRARFEMERDLRRAIQDDGLEMAYQPFYDVADNQLRGFEALLRWRHPLRGVVGPADFIPMAEETGLIVPIGAWVLEAACMEAAKWPATLKLAVNLSVLQLKATTLARTLRDALAMSGLAPSRLELEITESVLLLDSAETLATLHALREMGASISMDDFGTGYSSLGYLRSFPFSKIKIDQSFVRDIDHAEGASAIVRAVIGLGRGLGMVTTAEGVETPAQLRFLHREGCDQAQGYLFSRPVSAAAARQIIADSARVAIVSA